MKKISDQLQCSICSSCFKEPKLLPCFHVFCASPCLDELVSHDNSEKTIITCPICQNMTTLSEGGVADLPKDFHVEYLFQVCEALAKSREPNCEKCKKNPAVKYCRECKNFVCENCSEMHKMWGELAKHEIVPMDQVSADTTLLAPPKQTLRCKQHSNKKLKMYCNTCSQLICTICSMNLHKEHSYDLIQDAFKEHKKEIIFTLKPIREKLETIKEALVEFKTREVAIKEQKATIDSDISKEIQDLHEQLDQRKENLFQTLESITESKLQELEAHKQNIEMLQRQMSSCLEYTTSGFENGTDGEVLSIKASLMHRIEQVTKKFNATLIQPQLKADTKLSLNGKDEFLEQVHEKIHGNKDAKKKSFRGRYSPAIGEFADNLSTKFILVAKKIHPQTLPPTNTLETIDSFITEKLHHSKSIQLYALSNKHTIAEFKDYGTLNDYIQSNRSGFTIPQVMKLASQIAEAMACVEEHGYIHRDLALRNIVVGQNHLCLLGELAQVGEDGLFEASSKDKFAIKWTAPEAMFHNKFTIKSDVWSFGILLYELVTFGRVPYPGMPNTEVVQSLKKGYRMPRALFCPVNLYKIMQNCWQEDPGKRPTFETLQWQLEEFFDISDYVTMSPAAKTSDPTPEPSQTT